MISLYSIASLSILPLALTACVLLYEKNRRRLQTQLRQTRQQLTRTADELSTLRSQQAQARQFQQNLHQAELGNRLQQPVASRNMAASATPERYQYARSLIASGMEAQQLAGALSLSRQEAEQLVLLARISQGNQAYTAADRRSAEQENA